MKSIYAMMGRCTEPALGASVPAQHVELFFQVRLSPLSPGVILQPGVALLSPGHSLAEDGQEQGRRGDLRGVPGHMPGGEGLWGAPSSSSCFFCPKMMCWGHQEREGQRGHPGRDGNGTGEEGQEERHRSRSWERDVGQTTGL